MSISRRRIMETTETFLARYVIPLIRDTPHEPLKQIGSAVAIKSPKGTLLVSAAHVFENEDLDYLKIPERFTGPGLISIKYGDQPRAFTCRDAIAFQLTHSVAAAVRRGWSIVEWDFCRAPSDDALFAISGYPSERIVPRGEALGGSLMSMYTERTSTPEILRGAYDPKFDLILEYAREAEDINLNAVRSPELFGASGGPVWEIDTSKAEYKPERDLHLVGIQRSAGRNPWARVTTWPTVVNALSSL